MPAVRATHIFKVGAAGQSGAGCHMGGFVLAYLAVDLPEFLDFLLLFGRERTRSGCLVRASELHRIEIGGGADRVHGHYGHDSEWKYRCSC